MAFDTSVSAYNNASLGLYDKFQEYVDNYIKNKEYDKVSIHEEAIENRRKNVGNVERNSSWFEKTFHVNDKQINREKGCIDFEMSFINAFSFDFMQNKDPKDEVSYFNQAVKLANGQVLAYDKNNDSSVDATEYNNVLNPDFAKALDYDGNENLDVVEFATAFIYADKYGTDNDANGKFTYNDYVYALNCITDAKNVNENSSEDNKKVKTQVDEIKNSLYEQLAN